ncbi:MAG: hypothetical protein IIW55_06360 [Bacteroidales bacterium]|nr:hypothetical protein [Bacteroidales bacterium]
MKYKNTKYFLLGLIIFMININVIGQSDLSTPYSRFGLGDIYTGSPNTMLRGMGGIANAMSDNCLLNPSNPASYAAIDSLSFLFDAGFYIKAASFSTNKITERGSNASFDYASVGLSATRRWKIGLGITPFTNREYNVITEHNGPGSYNVAFQGEGGLNKVFFANGIKITDDLSVGITASYIFGTLFDNTSIYYPDSTYFLNGKRSIEMRVNDFKLDYGVLYRLPIDDYNITVGLTYSQGTKIASKRDIFIRNMFKGFENQVEAPIDTLKYIENENVNINIPGGFGLGVKFDKGDGWFVGADFNWNGWKGFTMNGVNDSLQNSWNVAIGGAYKPESTSISKYYKKITYRAGFHFDQTYYNIYGKSINRYGLTLGFGLPVPRSLTSFNVALEFGSMGTIKNDLVKENYFNISISMSIHDRWFIKRRYQ